MAIASNRTSYSQVAAPASGQPTGKTQQSNFGGSWNFGVATVLAQVSRDTVSSVAGDRTGRGYLLGSTVPVGSGVIKLSYSQYAISIPAAAGPDAKPQKLALGYVHSLSKRTAVYTTFARVKNNSTSNASVFNGAAAAGPAGASSTGYDLGIRHSF